MDAVESGARRHVQRPGVRVDSNCRKNLRIEIQNVPAGTYIVKVDGIQRGTIAGAGEIEFDTTPVAPEILLTFDPFGEVDIFQQAGSMPRVLSLTADATCIAP